MSTNADPSEPEPGIEWKRRFRDDIINSIDQQIDELIHLLPAEYFESLSEEDQFANLKALTAVRICDVSQEIMLRSRDGHRITVISHQNYAGLLADLIARLPHEGELVSAQIFSSRDKQFLIDIFDFKSDRTESDVVATANPEISETVATLIGGAPESVNEFLSNYHPGNPILNSPEEIANQFLALKETRITSDLAVLWQVRSNEKLPEDKRYAKVVVSSVNATTRGIFQRAAEFFAKHCIDVERAFCENISIKENTSVAILTFHICIENEAFDILKAQYGSDCSDVLDGDVLKEKLVAFLRLDKEVISPWMSTSSSIADHFGDEHFGDQRLGELFCALARLTHYAVMFRNDIEISREVVFRRLLRNEHTSEILTAFEQRFNVSRSEPKESKINLASISDVQERQIVQTLLELSEGIERTNAWLGKRRALAFRFPGKLIENDSRGETAFAVFYVYGQGFDGFHLRFRDVARGGLRIVPTRNTEHYLFESARGFDEVYRLASAQQLKNKDIAEGGAKAVVVLKPETNAERAGHDFVDALLDLITDIKGTSAQDSPSRAHEYLYLGPDENVSESLIEWIVDRADKRGYPIPETLMSSKPSSGINHKRYGVTSEGVAVFLHQALLVNQIDPTQQSFSVKMTGGPDGDVGGNAIRILVREFGDNVVFVAIADGTGAAADPSGLCHRELLRLVDNGLGIADFSTEKLGPNGSVRSVGTESDIAWRNSLHFTQSADVFVPAGGRPSAINENNWQDFLTENGSPTSNIIVEGANLFITEPARKHLSDLGVTIVKDSSANKCGVICSSLEIIAGMVLTPKEFQRIKPQYVEEVLGLLKSIARIEAISLFNEHARRPSQTLPEVSVDLSQQIIRTADVIVESFDRWNDEEVEITNQSILDFLPKSLVDHVGIEIIEQIPDVYRRQLAAAILSSRIVYREGHLNVCQLDSEQLESLVRKQLVYEQEVREIMNSLRDSDIAHREKIISILDHAGARAQRELGI